MSFTDTAQFPPVAMMKFSDPGGVRRRALLQMLSTRLPSRGLDAQVLVGVCTIEHRHGNPFHQEHRRVREPTARIQLGKAFLEPPGEVGVAMELGLIAKQQPICHLLFRSVNLDVVRVGKGSALAS